MKRPSSDALLTAAEWLDVNEGELGEGDECHAVAAWLRAEAQASDLRKVAREHHVPVERLRRKLNANGR